jgi:mannose-1-phosphate guanylyltransferase
MTIQRQTWAIVLAAGDGARLSALTTDERGCVVPKQFCSLNGGRSLLQDALIRARRLVASARVCVIVARQHERHWRRVLWSLPERNVIVQPRNCGTGNGVLLSLLHVLERDRLARVVYFPADHYVRDEAILGEAIRSVTPQDDFHRDGVTLVGIEPDDLDPELGYIVPGGPADAGARSVLRFVEKPTATIARDLIRHGAVWNSFIFSARGESLLELMRFRQPEIVEQMTSAFARRQELRAGVRFFDSFYKNLQIMDFSRHVAQGAEADLRVSAAPACGWIDLGTPRRVVQTVQRFRLATEHPAYRETVGPSVNLAAKVARLLSQAVGPTRVHAQSAAVTDRTVALPRPSHDAAVNGPA